MILAMISGGALAGVGYWLVGPEVVLPIFIIAALGNGLSVLASLLWAVLAASSSSRRCASWLDKNVPNPAPATVITAVPAISSQNETRYCI